MRLEDLDLKNGDLWLRDTKGNKDKMAVIGKAVCDVLQSYLLQVRPKWINAKNEKHVFLNRFGNGMTPNAVGAIVKKYVERSDIEKPASTHTLRGSSCTHMFRNGADIRTLQVALGHSSINSTQLYTQVVQADVHEMIRKFHPREKAFITTEDETENEDS